MNYYNNETILEQAREIESLRQQLLAALAVCEEKDEWLRFLSTVKNIDDVEKALAIKPDASALKAHDDALIERCAEAAEAEGLRDVEWEEGEAYSSAVKHCASAIRVLKTDK